MSQSPTPQPWPDLVFRSLLPNADRPYTAVDLYCGAGGFALGFAALGFHVVGFDSDRDSVATFSANVGTAHCADLHNGAALPTAHVLIAGPPCQPWSRAGKQQGELDDRDGFPSITRAIDLVEPIAVVVENVADVTLSHRRKSLDDFVTYLEDNGYAVEEAVLNASDYGVPQNRRRAFIFAMLGAIPVQPPAPADHQFSVGDAIADTCRLASDDARFLTKEMDDYIARYEKASKCRLPRDLYLDRPARTLTVRNLAGATGDMIRLALPCGRRRMLTIGESARLQSFPDWFRFVGSRQSQFSQIGNAVPPLLSLAVARQVRQALSERLSRDHDA